VAVQGAAPAQHEKGSRTVGVPPRKGSAVAFPLRVCEQIGGIPVLALGRSAATLRVQGGGPVVRIEMIIAPDGAVGIKAIDLTGDAWEDYQYYLAEAQLIPIGFTRQIAYIIIAGSGRLSP
jgi:hypothetical protein